MLLDLDMPLPLTEVVTFRTTPRADALSERDALRSRFSGDLPLLPLLEAFGLAGIAPVGA